MENVLVVSAHPDDETIGCGGTLLKHKKNGTKMHWLIMTNVDVKNGWKKEFVYKRQEEIKKIARIYGFKTVTKLDYPTTQLNEIPEREMLNAISKVVNNIKPTTVYLPNRGDVHSDHQITFKMLFSATKSFRAPFIKRILMYECLSETEFAVPFSDTAFIPNMFSDISAYLNEKINAMKVYGSEVMTDPFPRSLSSIEALARFRGSRIGCRFAEAFMILLDVN